jgi:hypothetical protein
MCCSEPDLLDSQQCVWLAQGVPILAGKWIPAQRAYLSPTGRDLITSSLTIPRILAADGKSLAAHHLICHDIQCRICPFLVTWSDCAQSSNYHLVSVILCPA